MAVSTLDIMLRTKHLNVCQAVLEWTLSMWMLSKKFCPGPRYLKGLSPPFILGRAFSRGHFRSIAKRDKRAPEPLWRKVIEAQACHISATMRLRDNSLQEQRLAQPFIFSGGTMKAHNLKWRTFFCPDPSATLPARVRGREEVVRRRSTFPAFVVLS